MNKKQTYFSLVVFAALILGGLTIFFSLPPSEAPYTGFEGAYQKALNQARAEHGLTPLVRNEILEKAARGKVQDMILHDYIKGVMFDGSSDRALVARTGYPMQFFIGEDIGRKYKTGEDFLSDMMTLNSQYIGSIPANEIGLYAVETPTGYVIAAEYGSSK